MTFKSLLLTSVLTLAAGCVSQVDGPIDYQVTGGLGGTGDGTAALHIELDGTMTRTPAGHGPRITKLDRATLGDLRRALADADLPAQSDYTECCDRYTHGISVELGGELHTVAVSDGVAVPRELQHAIDLLHALATD
jgi:hypothetical protein